MTGLPKRKQKLLLVPLAAALAWLLLLATGLRSPREAAGPDLTVPGGGVPSTNAGSGSGESSPDEATPTTAEGGPVATDPRPRGPLQASRPARVPRFQASGAGPAPPRFPADPAGLAAAVRHSMPEMKDCYAAWLKVEPRLQGKMVLGFSLVRSPEAPGEGQVRDVKIDSGGVGHTVMEGCVLSVFEDLRFAAPDEELEVKFPMAFYSDDGARSDGGPGDR